MRTEFPEVNEERGLVDLPLLGEIPAGRPGAAEGRAEACIPVSFEALDIQRNARCFVLKVSGDSMIGAHIVDGDLVVLELRSPHDGAVVAALIDGEAVLKRFVVRNGRPFLKAENPRYPELVPAQELVIQGVLRAVIRKAGA
jgi:repressor LexA